MYLVYLIKCDNLSYIGMTNDFTHRIRQHNQEIKGGAKYTKKRKTGTLYVLLMDFLICVQHVNVNGD